MVGAVMIDGAGRSRALSLFAAATLFESSRDTGGGFETYAMNADGSNRTRLTNSAVFEVAPERQRR